MRYCQPVVPAPMPAELELRVFETKTLAALERPATLHSYIYIKRIPGTDSASMWFEADVIGIMIDAFAAVGLPTANLLAHPGKAG